MQEVQRLRLEIERNLDLLPLESLKMAAKYVAELCKSTHNEDVELETPTVAQIHNGNHQRATLMDNKTTKADWEAWFAESDKLTEKILARRNGKFIDTDGIWDAVEADWEERDNRILGNRF